MANAGINTVVGHEEPFTVAFISFQTPLDVALVKLLCCGQRAEEWSATLRLLLLGKGLEPLEGPVQRRLSSLLLVHVVSIEIVYCEGLSATGLSKT